MESVADADLKWSDQSTSGARLTLRNAPGGWSNGLWDPMLRSYVYAWNGGNITILLTNLPSGNCDIYVYGHTEPPDGNSVFELWSDEIDQGIKGTSLVGYGPTSNHWEVGQQYVLFKDVTVSSNKPVILHSKHTAGGYQNISGVQIAYTSDTVDRRGHHGGGGREPGVWRELRAGRADRAYSKTYSCRCQAGYSRQELIRRIAGSPVGMVIVSTVKEAVC